MLGILGKSIVKLVVLLLVIYVISLKMTGNPYFYLYAVEDVYSTTIYKEISGNAPINENLVTGFKYFIKRLLSIDNQSFITINPVFAALERIGWTILPFIIGLLSSYLIVRYLFINYGKSLSRYIGILSFLPGYLYALVFTLVYWLMKIPPTVGHPGIRDITVYSIVIILIVTPRLYLYTTSMLSQEDVLLYNQYKAMGYDDKKIRNNILAKLNTGIIYYSIVLLCGVSSRILYLEPLLSYNGIGKLMLNGILTSDFYVISYSIIMLSTFMISLMSIGEIITRTKDPRMSL